MRDFRALPEGGRVGGDGFPCDERAGLGGYVGGF